VRRVHLLLASLLLATPLVAQDATTYLPLLEDLAPEALSLLEDLDGDGSVEQRMAALDALCRFASDREVGNALVLEPSGVMRGLRSLLRGRVRDLSPEERGVFVDYQEQLTTALEQQGSEALLRRSPASEAAGRAWRARLESALEAGDIAGAAWWLEAARGWGHAGEGPAGALCDAWTDASARGELAQIGSRVAPAWAPLAAAWAQRPERVALPRREPQLLANVRLPGSNWEDRSPSVPLLTPRRVIVSTGSAVLRYSRNGTLLSQFPQRLDGAAPPPDDSTGLLANLTRFGGEVFTPLALERWLAPAREPAESSEGDPALGGYFYGLVGLDVETLRVAWWDGDPGTREAATPLSPSAEVERLLRAGHVIACASDGARIYVAFLTKGTELSLYLFAYRPVTRIGADLCLEPAWPAPLRVAQVEHGGTDDQAVRPEVAVRLTLDGCGRLVCATDVGIVACASAISGDMEWLHERFVEAKETEFRRWGPRQTPEPPPPPTQALVAPDPRRPELGPIAVALVGPELLGVRLRTGEVLWNRARDKQEYLLPGDGVEFLAYGFNEALALDAATGKPIYARGRPLSIGTFRFCGIGVQTLEGYLIPVRHNQSKSLSLHRLRWRELPTGDRTVLFDGSHRLPLTEAVNLAIDADHVVAVSSNRMQVLSFSVPDDSGR